MPGRPMRSSAAHRTFSSGSASRSVTADADHSRRGTRATRRRHLRRARRAARRRGVDRDAARARQPARPRFPRRHPGPAVLRGPEERAPEPGPQDPVRRRHTDDRGARRRPRLRSGRRAARHHAGHRARPCARARGEPSTDPREFYGDPPGSLLTAGAHKGYGLSLAIEILGGILSGTGGASAEKGKFANGTLIVALDPARFLPPAEFHAQVAALFAWVRGASPAAGASEILVPGEPEARTERARRAEGVGVEDETWRQITACASEGGGRG